MPMYQPIPKVLLVHSSSSDATLYFYLATVESHVPISDYETILDLAMAFVSATGCARKINCQKESDN